VTQVCDNLAGLTAQLHRIIALHFDPAGGSPYWLEKARELGMDPRQAIRTMDDLALLGPMDTEALASRPVEDFVPAALLQQRDQLLVAETGGTLGRPRFAVYRSDEFEAGFVRPFVAAAGRAGFPRGENWLFIGPTGPHIIGRGANGCATALGGPAPFCVDFDPRWAKKLPEGSFARGRYLEHIVDQAMHVLNTQRIGVIFSTPPVLERLADRTPPEKRAQVRGIHFGGMAVSSTLREKLTTSFPRAVMLSGYGNTLFGMVPELRYTQADGIDYFPHGWRLVIGIVESSGGVTALRIARPVRYGERGQVMVHRLDETQFLANLLERDTAIRIGPLGEAATDGFELDGLRDPQPIVDEATRPTLGLY
jgi:hypothetical protein